MTGAVAIGVRTFRTHRNVCIPIGLSYHCASSGSDRSLSIAGYSRDAAGNRDAVSYGNGTSTVYAYKSGDPGYFIDTITHKRDATELLRLTYTRDNAGDPLSMTEGTDWTWTYDYDQNNRLSLASPPVPVPDQPAGGIYAYDWVGNRPNPPADPNQMVYNKADQLLIWPGMHTYSYYKDGSLNEEKDASGVTQRTYTYTDDGLLEYAYDGNNNVIGNFTWDADKNRVGMVMGGGTYSFVYDTTAGIPAVIEESGGTSGVYCFREPGGALIARLKGSDWRWYHFDELGSTRLLTDSSGSVTDRYAYDVWGRLISHAKTATSVDQPYQYVGRLGYYTHYRAPDLGLLQLGVRFYYVAAGRFPQIDRVRNYKVSSYIYANDVPHILVDPSGKSVDLWRTCPTCNNCYTYGMGDLRGDPDPFKRNQQPGFTLPGGGLPNSPGAGRCVNCGNMLSNATREYHALPGGFPNKPAGCGAGYHKACLYIDADGDMSYDYHWLRQEPDGSWSSKHGGELPVGGITDPTGNAAGWGYEHFCGCLCVPNSAAYDQQDTTIL